MFWLSRTAHINFRDLLLSSPLLSLFSSRFLFETWNVFRWWPTTNKKSRPWADNFEKYKKQKTWLHFEFRRNSLIDYDANVFDEALITISIIKAQILYWWTYRRSGTIVEWLICASSFSKNVWNVKLWMTKRLGRPTLTSNIVWVV